MEHIFSGKWITRADFTERQPRNVFHRQLETVYLPDDEKQNSHVLFRKKITVNETPKSAHVFITADDYYKLYINGQFVGQGPAPSYHSRYNYNEIDITEYLTAGENTVAVHTYYQGLINRVWQSGDYRHGLLCDFVVDGKTVAKSDESFLVQTHTGYSLVNIYGGGLERTGAVGYDTQFLECYDSRVAEVGFEKPGFDDSGWTYAKEYKYADYTLVAQSTKSLVFERIAPVETRKEGNIIRVDFGGAYVGYLSARAKGANGEKITLRMGQELNEDGSVRYKMRCNCNYLDEWILSGNEDELVQYDYKPFRYAEIETDGAEVFDVFLIARHYPFELKAKLAPEYQNNPDAVKIWELCVRTQKYGVQEVIQDCPDREKGFYLGDGCYSALCHYLLTGDDSMMRKLIDDAFYSTFISEGMVTCMDCSFMQEIAEYPLILVEALLWHYRLSGDKEYLRENFYKAVKLLDSYKKDYEKDGLLCNLDKWCVVEWPPNYQDGYAVDILEGKVCHEPHVSINAYYLRAVQLLNKMAEILEKKPYRDEDFLKRRFIEAFYDKKRHLFCDGTEHRHISLIGNCFPYAFSIIPDDEFGANFLALLEEKGYSATSFFSAFPVLCGMVRRGELKRVKDFLLDEGTWKRMLREGATTIFEGWGKDVKWNTSLFHMTFSYAAVFLADINLEHLFA